MNPLVGAGLISGGANILGGLIGKSGQKDANRQNIALAREQMRFQERMSSTAYQRATDDLAKSGLNRILALGSPASTPAGARANVLSETAPLAQGVMNAGTQSIQAINSAAGAQQAMQSAETLKKQQSLLTNQAEKVLKEVDLVVKNTKVASAQAEVSDALSEIVKQIRTGIEETDWPAVTQKLLTLYEDLKSSFGDFPGLIGDLTEAMKDFWIFLNTFGLGGKAPWQEK